MAFINQAIKDARKLDGAEADPDTLRQLKLIRTATTLPAPNDAAKRKELAELVTKLDSMYATGKWGCADTNSAECKDLGAAEDIISNSDDYDEQLRAWEGWHSISPPMRPLRMSSS